MMKPWAALWLGLLALAGSAGAAPAAELEEVRFLFSSHTAALPTISSLSPSSAPAGDPSFTLTVRGANFVSGAAVRWNGSARTTSFVSATQLTAAIPASDLNTPGTALVTVALPSGATTGTAAFAVTSQTTLLFAQIAEGRVPGEGAFRTTLILLNPGEAPVSATVEFFSSPDGAPLLVDLGIGPQPEFEVRIAAKSQVTLTTQGTRTSATAGWVRVRSADSIGGLAIFQFFNNAGAFVTEAGVASSPVARRFVVPAEFRDGFETGLALANPDPAETADVRIHLRQGGVLVATARRELGPGRHTAVFLRELFAGLVAAGFQGSLEIESSAPLAATTLRTLRGLQTSTLPVVVGPGGR